MSRGNLITDGIRIVDWYGKPVQIDELISDTGGQGDVYRVTYKGKSYAMKWYCVHEDDIIGGKQYNNIVKLMKKPKPHPSFIWPIALTREENTTGNRFGFIMDLIPDNYFEMAGYLRANNKPKAVRFSDINSKVTAGLNIVNAMRHLHMSGLSYKDLNPKNFAIDRNGKVIVCDIDNISVDGDPCTVKGMKGYMAPEIVRSGYKINPCLSTDYYSLAVVLYRLFFYDEPMEGKKWEEYPIQDDEVEEKLLSIEPVFHHDPNNRTNRATKVYGPNNYIPDKPDGNRQPTNWEWMPQDLKDMFIRVFTDGISNADKRPADDEWTSVLSGFRSRLVATHNDRWMLVDFSDKKNIPQGCLAIKQGKQIAAVYPGKAIYQYFVDRDCDRYNEVIGGFYYNNEMRIINKSERIWRCYMDPRSNSFIEVGNNETCLVKPGVRILFDGNNSHMAEIIDPMS